MNVNETESNQDTFEEVIYKCPDDAYPDMIDDSINEELDDMNQNYLYNENKISLDE